jgi:hypothetical protein
VHWSIDENGDNLTFCYLRICGGCAEEEKVLMISVNDSLQTSDFEALPPAPAVAEFALQTGDGS